MTREGYVTMFRAFIKDNDYLNRLLKFEEENSDTELTMYLEMATGFLSSIPPFVYRPTLDDESFPFSSLIIHQAAIEALISNSIVQARNELTYNNGGITVKVDDGNRYMGLLQALWKMADREINYYTKWLVAININAGFGGVGSPYQNLGNEGVFY